jgi:Acyl-CoA thioesterase C-terminal domain/Acyl-CoA thioesterase N-terminal domain
MSMPSALFERDGAMLLPTALCRGPWDHGYLHGGAVCGAVGWALEQVRADEALVLARATVEIRSMVPLGPLRTHGTVVKPGRRTQVIEATLANDTGVVARATSQWVLHRPSEAPPARQVVPARPVPAADPGAVASFDYPRPGFNCDAVELRPLKGTTETAGPGVIWVRLRAPVVEGEPTSGLLSTMTLSDIGIAVGWEPSPTGAAFINPDVTVQINRYPIGAWVLMDSRVHAAPSGVGFCETVLSDDTGPFGRVLQTLVEAPESLTIGIPTVT